MTEKKSQSFQKIGKGHIFINDKTFDLTELMRMGSIIVAAIDFARADDFDGTLAFMGSPDSGLHSRSMTAEKSVGINYESILPVTCWMIKRNIP